MTNPKGILYSEDGIYEICPIDHTPTLGRGALLYTRKEGELEIRITLEDAAVTPLEATVENEAPKDSRIPLPETHKYQAQIRVYNGGPNPLAEGVYWFNQRNDNRATTIKGKPGFMIHDEDGIYLENATEEVLEKALYHYEKQKAQEEEKRRIAEKHRKREEHQARKEESIKARQGDASVKDNQETRQF